ncbi:MAG: STAS domain-containing protein [Fibrobacterota bacterium]
MSDKLQLETEEYGSFLLVRAAGELSERTTARFKNTLLAEIQDHGHTHMVIDFSACEYVNSSGVGILNLIAKKLMNLGGRLALINPSDSVRDILATSTDEDALIKEYTNLEEAASDLAKDA